MSDCSCTGTSEASNRLAPQKWAELRDVLIQIGVGFNSEPGMEGTLAFDESDPAALEIEDTTRETSLRIEFDPASREVRISGPEPRVFGIAAIPGGSDAGFFEASSEDDDDSIMMVVDGVGSISSYDIAMEVLGDLLDA